MASLMKKTGRRCAAGWMGLAALTGAVALTAPADAQQFERTIGTPDEERAEWTAATSDGGSIICGWKRVAGLPDSIYVMKLDPSGATQWESVLLGQSFEIANRVIETQDGGYALAGETASNAAGFGISLIKLDGGGALQWARAYPGTPFVGGAGGGTAFDETSDGGFVLVGRWQNAVAQQAPVIIRTDAGGNIVWQEQLIDLQYLSNTFGSFHDVHPIVNDDGTEHYIAAGWLANQSFGSRDALLVRFDSTGGVVWARTYGDPSHTDMAYGVDPLANSDIAMCGFAKSIGEGGGTFLTRVDAGGNLIWWNTYRFFGSTNALEETAGGRLILAGNANDFATYDDNALMLTDAAGNFAWGMRYGGAAQQYGESVALYPNGYQMAAWTNSYGAGNFDVYAVRTDLAGVTNCQDRPFQVIQAPDQPEIIDRDFEQLPMQEVLDYQLEPLEPFCRNLELCPCPTLPCLGDFDGNGVVGFSDLIAILSNWGPCTGTCCIHDLDGDGIVGFSDLVMALSLWGPC